MRIRHFLPFAALLALALGQPAIAEDDNSNARWKNSPIVKKIRMATEVFKDVNAALAAGYIDTGNCVSGPNRGAMGVHFVNIALMFDDGTVDVNTPEVLIYEPLANGRMRLVGVEYVSIDDGDPATGAPVVEGHLLNYAGAPNRYGLPPNHELHVWAWKRNPEGTFADWNPRVSCNAYGGPVSHGH